MDPFKRYAKARNRPLKVFMPFVHTQRAIGIARTLKRAGHLLYMQAENTTARWPAESFLRPEDAASFGDNVRIYQRNEVFENPPDVVIIGRPDGEENALELCAILAAAYPTTIIGYSGVFQTNYTWGRYSGFICSDLPTRTIARYNKKPAIRYYEDFDADEYPFTEWKDDGIFHLSSYVGGLEERFPLAWSFWCRCRDIMHAHFGGRVVVENFQGLPPSEIARLMRRSAMTLHIKDDEGLGWSVMESLATGRPIISQRGLSKNMTYNEWTEEHLTGFYISEPEDLINIVNHFLVYPSVLKKQQHDTAAIFRKRWDGRELADDFNAFIEDLHRVDCAAWAPGIGRHHSPRPISPYLPNLDRSHVQDFERIPSLTEAEIDRLRSRRDYGTARRGDEAATDEDVRWLFRCLLGRFPEDQAGIDANRPKGATFTQVRAALMNSDEYIDRMREGYARLQDTDVARKRTRYLDALGRG